MTHGASTLVQFSALDTAVALAFVALMLALGFSVRLQQNTMLQFLAAGRSLTLPVFVATLVTTWYGGILGVGESVADFGWGAWLLLGVPYYLFGWIYARFFSARVRAAAQLSLPERLEMRYGRSVGLTGALLIFLLAVPSAQVLMLGVLLQCVSGLPLAVSVVLATGIGSLFLYRGGLLADARASLIAFAMMYLGFFAMIAYCLTHYPLTATLSAITDKHLLQFSGGASPAVVFGFFVLGAWTLVDPAFHQRAASAASEAIGTRGVYVSVALWFLFDSMTITTGMYALALLRPMPADTMMIYPAFAQAILPSGLKGLFICGIAGTVLSATVGYMLVSGATVGRELIARVKKGVSEAEVTAWSRAGIFLSCVAAIVLALTIPSVVSLWYDWGGVLVGALLPAVVLSYRGSDRTHAAPWSVLASMTAGFAASCGWLIYGRATGNPDLSVRAFGDTIQLGTMVPSLAISSLTLGCCGVVASQVNRSRIRNDGRPS